MPNYLDRLNADPLPWLLEEDDEQSGVRYYAQRWLLGLDADAPEVRSAQAAVMRSGPVPKILDAQRSEGWWEPESKLFSKYTSTGWQLIFLAGLGADPDDERVQRAAARVLDQGPAPSGGLSYSGSQSGVIHCANGDLVRALIEFGCLDDARTRAALEWCCDAILGAGDPQYRASGTSGPGFGCGVNGKLPCAWGAVKELRARASVPPRRRTKRMRAALDAGVEFLLGHDLASADFPTDTSISSRWFKFGFPASYSADILELLLALTEAGRVRDARAAPGIELLLSKQDEAGRWSLETTLNGGMIADVEVKGRPSKWVTLRALRVLMGASGRRRLAAP